jgi:hypothetical protein
MALPIEDYALIGDRGTAALVGKDGSIDWLCLPRFDSPACFAALLGTEENGRWLLAPADEVLATSRRYLDGTACLETTFTVADGEVVLLDVMPVGDDRADVVRRLTCTRGTVRIRHDWVVRTDYGRVRPWVSRETTHGDEVTFTTTWVRSGRDTPRPLGFEARLDATTARQREWSARSPEDVPHADQPRGVGQPRAIPRPADQDPARAHGRGRGDRRDGGDAGIRYRRLSHRHHRLRRRRHDHLSGVRAWRVAAADPSAASRTTA